MPADLLYPLLLAGLVPPAPHGAADASILRVACGAFRPAAGQRYRLTRELERETGGPVIRETRVLELTFAPAGRGWIAEARLISLDIEVPERLRGLVPLMQQAMAGSGTRFIMDGGGLVTGQQALELRTGVAAALGPVDRQLAASGADAAMRARAGDAIRALAAREQDATPHWPVALFGCPGGAGLQRTGGETATWTGREEHTIDGGSLTVDLQGAYAHEDGLMRQFRRETVAEAAGARRLTRELWRLEPAIAP